MSFPGFESGRYSKSWAEMSYDARLMFVYQVTMMFLFITGELLSFPIEIAVAAGLTAACAVLAVRHRRRTPWVWPGLSLTRLLRALATALMGGYFLVASSPLSPPTDPAHLPWYLAGFGIILFGTLHALALVAFAEADYFTPPPPPMLERTWKRIVRTVFGILFLAVWLEAGASFYCFGVAFRDGSPVPTATQTESLSNHSKIAYVTPSQKRRVKRLQRWMSVGIPSAILVGFMLHFVLGVKIVPDAPTRT